MRGRRGGASASQLPAYPGPAHPAAWGPGAGAGRSSLNRGVRARQCIKLHVWGGGSSSDGGSSGGGGGGGGGGALNIAPPRVLRYAK